MTSITDKFTSKPTRNCLRYCNFIVSLFLHYPFPSILSFNLFAHLEAFWCLCIRWLLFTLWQMEKLFKTSNFSFCHNVFNSIDKYTLICWDLSCFCQNVSVVCADLQYAGKGFVICYFNQLGVFLTYSNNAIFVQSSAMVNLFLLCRRFLPQCFKLFSINILSFTILCFVHRYVCKVGCYRFVACCSFERSGNRLILFTFEERL